MDYKIIPQSIIKWVKWSNLKNCHKKKKRPDLKNIILILLLKYYTVLSHGEHRSHSVNL